MPVPPLPLNYKLRPARGATVKVKSPRRVFICDDDLDFAEELAQGLSASGYETRTLASDASAIRILETFRPDLMLLDIYMSPPDGFEMINHMRQSAENREIPLVLISGAGAGLLEVATRFCIARKLRLAAAFQKPLNLLEIIRVCDVHTRQ
jgi:PleD family two-component response regulator